MIVLELRRLASPDAEPDTWVPESDAVWVAIEVEIGVRGEAGQDVFYVNVATPLGLLGREVLDHHGAIASGSTIVLREFSWRAVRAVLESILCECADQNWTESVLKLQRYFAWEYEDYVPEGTGGRTDN
jgi:hypothetical protein